MEELLEEGNPVIISGPYGSVEGVISHIVDLQNGRHYSVKIGDYVWINAPRSMMKKIIQIPKRMTDMQSDGYSKENKI